jgi:hypothetical protein
MKVSNQLFGIALLVLCFSSLGVAVSSGWTMSADNQSVYWSDNGYKISAFPAVSRGLIDQEQFVNFSSTNPANLVTNMSFVFPFQITKGSVALLTNMSHAVSVPVYGRVNASTVLNVSSYALTSAACDFGDALNTYKYNVSLYGNVSSVVACFDAFSNVSSVYSLNYSYNGSTGNVVTYVWYPDWQDISSGFTHTDIGVYDVFTINNVQFNAGTNYQTRFRYSIPVSTSSGKFDIYAHTGSPADVVNGVATVYLQLDPWWNATWNRRVPFYMNSTGAVSDYQVMINVNSTNFNMSEINADCSDLRTTYLNASGSELTAPYWIESCNTSSNSIVWAKVNLLAGNTTINVYHKNNTAVTTTSDGVAAFIFFDDFNGNAINGTNWEPLTNSAQNVSGGLLRLTYANKYYSAVPYLLTQYNYPLVVDWSEKMVGAINTGAVGGVEFSRSLTRWFWSGGGAYLALLNGTVYTTAGDRGSFLIRQMTATGEGQANTTTDNNFNSSNTTFNTYSAYFVNNTKSLWKNYGTSKMYLYNNTNFLGDGNNYYISIQNVPLNTGKGQLVDWFRLRKYTPETLVSSFGATENAAAASVIGFSAQSPTNITSTTLYSQRIFLNYSINNSLSGINTSLVRMWYNMSRPPIVNGTYDVMPQSFSPASNISDLFLFNMGETKNYPATYNVNQLVMQNTTHISRQLNTSDSWYSVKLLNITNNQTANVFEIMFNSTGSTQATDVWACNSSYTTGSISSPNCVILQTIPSSNAFNHSHPNADNSLNLSKHHVIPMNINTTTGKIGSVYVTPVMTFLVKSPKNNPNLLVYGISGTARTGAFAISTNNGGTWTADDTMIADAHVHQFDSITTNEYWVEACDLSSPALCANSTHRYINSTAVPTAPSSVTISSPTASNYEVNSNISIAWSAAIPGEGSVISNYSVELLNSDDSVNQTIATGVTDLTYSWNATIQGSFVIRVTAYASNGLSSIGLSPEFNITKIVTSVRWLTNPATPITYGVASNFSCLVNVTGLVPRLEVNGTNTTLGINVTRAAGSYLVNCSYAGNENYSASVDNSTTYVINKASGTAVLKFNNDVGNKTETYGTLVNISGSTTQGSITLFKNGTDVTAQNNVFQNLSAGFYNYTAVSSGNENYSEASVTYFLTISKAAGSVVLLLNGVSNDVTITYGAQSNASGSTSFGILELKRNGTTITNNQLQTLAAGYYNFTASSNGDENHTAASLSRYLTINKATPVGTLTNSTAWSIVYGTSTTIGLTESNTGDADVTYTIYRNGTSIGTGETATLAAGFYNYTLSSNAGQNYSAAVLAQQNLTISKAPQILIINALPSTSFTYGTPLNVSVSGNMTFGTLLRNGTNVTNQNNVNVTLGAGSYNYTWSAVANENYSANTTTQIITINKATSVVTKVVSPASPITYGANSTFSCSVNQPVSVKLYVNGSDVTATQNGTSLLRAAGSYFVNCSYAGNENYTASESSEVYVINKVVVTATASVTPPSPVNFGVNSTFSCSVNQPVTATMLINGVDKTSENGTSIRRAIGNYTINCTYTGNQNYSAASDVKQYEVRQYGADIACSQEFSTDTCMGEQLGLVTYYATATSEGDAVDPSLFDAGYFNDSNWGTRTDLYSNNDRNFLYYYVNYSLSNIVSKASYYSINYTFKTGVTGTTIIDSAANESLASCIQNPVQFYYTAENNDNSVKKYFVYCLNTSGSWVLLQNGSSDQLYEQNITWVMHFDRLVVWNTTSYTKDNSIMLNYSNLQAPMNISIMNNGVSVLNLTNQSVGNYSQNISLNYGWNNISVYKTEDQSVNDTTQVFFSVITSVTNNTATNAGTTYLYDINVKDWESMGASFINISTITINGTTYNATFNGENAGILTYTASILMPVSGVKTNYTITSNITTYLGTMESVSTITEASPAIIQDCGANITGASLQFKTYDEDDFTTRVMQADYALDIDIYTGDVKVGSTIIQKLNASNMTICISPIGTTYQVTGRLVYNSEYSTNLSVSKNFTQRTYYLYNATLNNVTQYINVYLLDKTQAFNYDIYVRDEYESPVENVYVSIQKLDYVSGSYISVMSVKSDSEGHATANLQSSIIFYKFIAYYEGAVIRDFEPKQITINPIVLHVTLTPISVYNYFNELQYSNYESNASIRVMITDPSGLMTNTNFVVINDDTGAVICNQTSTASAINSVCNANFTNITNVRYYATSVIQGNTRIIFQRTIRNAYDVGFGNFGLFVMFALMIMMGFVAKFNPAVSLVFMFIAIVASQIMGLVDISWTIIGGLALVIGVVIIKLRT